MSNQTQYGNSALEMRSKQVLIIDPDVATQQRLKAVLDKLNAIPVIYSTGAAALQHGDYSDVVGSVLEIDLPDVSGLFVLNELRRHSETPVVIFSAEQDVETAVSVLKEDIFDFIVKPSREAILQQRLKQLLEVASYKVASQKV